MIPQHIKRRITEQEEVGRTTCRRLVVDSHFETRGAPVHELDGALRFDGANGSVHVLGDNVAAVHHGAGDVLAVPGIALGHHAGRLEHAVAELTHRELLMVCLLCRNDGRVRGEHEVDRGYGTRLV
jgi:hypothetical protein